MTKIQKRGKTMGTSKSYLSKVVKEMPDSGIKDFFDIANTMEGALSLGVGEPDFPTPEHVREAAIASIKRELGGKWAVGVVIGQCVIAWLAAFVVYLVGGFFF